MNGTLDPFEDWVAAEQQYACFQEWGKQVVALGASWDTFRRDRTEITKDLVEGGIPLLAARDIVDIASKEVQRAKSPMAIFWDLENMPIPSAVSGRDLVSSLKTILAPHGDLIQFRGYASIGLNLIPQEKRSDLQLSGCHLVDCPHSGRKEVADKMIIVDAMQFAYHHPDGATLCFITGDIDYAYLLAVLQRNPDWRTIVVSRGTMQSMLHVNCHTKMRWETDILQTIYAASSLVDTEASESVVDSSDERSKTASTAGPRSKGRFVPLTADEFWKDDVELLRSLVIQIGRRTGTISPRKSQIGNELRQANPARFPHRDAIKSFFVDAIDKGIVVEHGDGALKTLTLAEHNGHPTIPGSMNWMKPSTRSPLPIADWPEKAVDLAKLVLPYALIVKKLHCPAGSAPAILAYTQGTDEWLLLLYKSHGDVIKSVGNSPWLRKGTLVFWNDLLKKTYQCAICDSSFDADHAGSIVATNAADPSLCSSECQIWNAQDSSIKDKALQNTKEALEFMAENDDIYVAEPILIKILALRNPDVDTRVLRLWIHDAVAREMATRFHRPEVSKPLICLTEYFEKAIGGFPPVNFDTTREEEFVKDLLWTEENEGGLDRVLVAKKLASEFGDRMATSFHRNKVLLNAQSNGLIYLCKGPFLHMVGLTKEQAETAMTMAMEKRKTSVTMYDAASIANDNTSGSQHVSSVISSTDEPSHQSSAASFSTSTDDGSECNEPEYKREGSFLNASSNSGQRPLEALLFEEPKASHIDTGSIQSQKKQVDYAPVSAFSALVDSNGNSASPNLHVSGYGLDTTRSSIQRMFSYHARIKEVVAKTSGCRSFMFVNTYSREDAIEARKQLHGTVVNGGKLKINFAK